MSFLPYDVARDYVADLEIKNLKGWWRYLKKTELFYVGDVLCHPLPHNIPKWPHMYYTNTGDWVSWDHFLSYKMIKPNDKKAHKTVDIIKTLKELKLEDERDWNFYRLTNNLGIDYYNRYGQYVKPLLNTSFYYGNLRILYGIRIQEYLVGKKFEVAYTYEKAKQYFRDNHNFKSVVEYCQYIMDCHKNCIRPFAPGITPYPLEEFKLKKQWVDWADYLGFSGTDAGLTSANIVKKPGVADDYLSFEQVREIIWTYNFRTPHEYLRWANTRPTIPFYNSLGQYCLPRPKGVPLFAPSYFKVRGEWTNWRDFLNLPDKKSNGYTVAEIAAVAKKHNIKSKKEWIEFSKISEYPRDLKQYFALKNQFFPGFIILLENGLTKRMRLDEMKTFLIIKNIQSNKEYIQWVKDNGSPDYMPKSLYYYRQNHPNLNIDSLFPQQFMKKLDRQQEVIDIGVVYVSKDRWLKSNMYFITHDIAGRANAMSVIKRLERTLIAMYDIDGAQMTIFKKIISAHSTQYPENGQNCYIVPNMTELLNELDVIHVRTDLQ